MSDVVNIGSDVPIGWEEARIGDLCDLVNGRAFKPIEWSKNGIPIIRIQNLNNPAAPFNYCCFPVEDKYYVSTEDLLFAWSGTPGTSFGAHIWRGPRAVLNQHIFRVVFSDRALDKNFFRLAINERLESIIARAHGGVGLRHITKGKFEDTTVWVPPLNEQRRIADKITTLDTHSRAARKHLDAIPPLLEQFRASVLSAAFTGRLTADWREEHGISQSEAWTEVELHEVLREKPKNGYSAKPVQHETPFRVLTLTATTSGSFDARFFKYTDEVIPEDSPFWLNSGDILVQRGNTIEYVGVPALYNGPSHAFIYPDLMIKLRVNSRTTPEFLCYALSSAPARTYMRARATGIAGNMPKINQTTLMGVPVILPPLVEQREIVHRIQTAFRFADAVRENHAAALSRSPLLNQSILAKAFRGELVPQDTNDEPATELLKRIAEEKEKMQAARKETPRKGGRRGK